MGFALPENLVDSVRSDPSPRRVGWLASLPGLVAEYANRWLLDLQPPYQPGGRCAWVAPARDREGRDLVLKVAWRHDEAVHEADGLRAWAGDGAIRLHGDAIEDDTTVLLLERCRPGTALGEALPEPEQDVAIAALLRRLWTAPTDGYPFRPLRQMCDAWAAEFDRRLSVMPGLVDPGLARAGIDLLRTLPATAERQVLLCTDLHAGLAHRIADLLDLDPDRLMRWLFARCVQESLDQPVFRDVADRIAPT